MSNNYEMNDKPIVIDLYCGAGGATRGYQREGCYVIGVDSKPQPRYVGDEFIQGDVFDVWPTLPHDSAWLYHASPPCQVHSTMTKGIWKDRLKNHKDLIPATRKLLKSTGKLYVIENVAGARKELINPLMLCGTMFNLRASDGAQLWRHRYFECFPDIWFPPSPCNHEKRPAIGVYGSTGGKSNRDGKVFHGIEDRKLAMGIDWMIGKELNQAIPPAYTEWICGQMLTITGG